MNVLDRLHDQHVKERVAMMRLNSIGSGCTQVGSFEARGGNTQSCGPHVIENVGASSYKDANGGESTQHSHVDRMAA